MPSLRGRLAEAIHLSTCEYVRCSRGLLRFARNDGSVFSIAGIGQLIAVAVALGLLSYAHPAIAESRLLRITGSINSCYGPDPGYVFLQAVPPNDKLKTPIIRVGKDRHFVVSVPASRFLPGEYYLNFSAGPDKSGFGALRIKVAGSSVDIGVIGDCDV